jgi:integrase
MARTIGKLLALQVGRDLAPGMSADGGGLYLQVTGTGAKSWIFRFTLAGKAREMGLGPLSAIPLADARLQAAECRALRQKGIDPIEARNAARQQTALEAAKVISFSQAAKRYMDAHKASWRNPKHRQQWENTLATYAYPIIGKLPVQSVDTDLVLKVIEPIWSTKPETASRLRGRIEVILDWAKVRGLRAGENPARWRGHLDKLLPRPSKVRTVRHHPALPYSELPDFMERLRGQANIAALALEFTILTTARTNEAIRATIAEFKLDDRIWIVPSNRMKAGREHRVPLCDRAVEIVRCLSETATGAFIFPGTKRNTGLSNMAMLALLERMQRTDLTVHGFRSTFKDWASETTGFPNELVEMALAHAVGDKVEAAYRRGDMFDKRRRLMGAWADYCSAPTATGMVIPLRGQLIVGRWQGV